jgi:lipoprotein NlpI
LALAKIAKAGCPVICASALADLDQASALDPKNAYSALWLDIITTRNNLPNCLSQLVSKVDMTKWPAPLVRLFMGELTPTAALPAADDADLNQKKGRVCEANFGMTLDRLTTAAIEGIADQM